MDNIVLKVFIDKDNKYGNPVKIIIDEQNEISNEERQEICHTSGFSEVVFINNIKQNQISIFSPTREIPFAGHAVLETVYFLNKITNSKIDYIECMNHKINVSYDNDKIWVKAKLETMPNWNFEEYKSIKLIEELNVDNTKGFKHCLAWTCIDREKGLIRARTFAPDWLIPEDEANGSGSMLLASKLDKTLEIHHGKGSIIYARPVNFDSAEVSGVVIIDSTVESNN